MPSPQKAKGSGYEREVAKFLTELYGESFIRAPGSGAYVGGKNQGRKEFLHEGQVRSFKGDIVPGQSFSKMNAECKFYKDFSFHLLLTGKCAQLDSWLEQLLDVEDEGDMNILFMKFNRIGQYVAVQPKLTWRMLNYTFYASEKYGDWLITEKTSFFKDNEDLVKIYSKTPDTTSKQTNLITIET
jgi:Holliday junction resolvase